MKPSVISADVLFEDHREALAALQEKRVPKFTGK